MLTTKIGQILSEPVSSVRVAYWIIELILLEIILVFNPLH
jgi:hypothetical protein